MSDLELCIRCQEPTGRAGWDEDSLYASGFGPYCSDCWDDIPHEFAEQIEALQKRCVELEREKDELQAGIQNALADIEGIRDWEYSKKFLRRTLGIALAKGTSDG